MLIIKRKFNEQKNLILSTMLNGLILLSFSKLSPVEAGSKGDDIILTKGKLIVRGGKGKGKLEF